MSRVSGASMKSRRTRWGRRSPGRFPTVKAALAIDLWLFSTNPDLMDQYTQEELDQLLLKPAGHR